MRKFLISKNSSETSSENPRKRLADDAKFVAESTPAKGLPTKRTKIDVNKPELLNKINTDYNKIDFSCTKTCSTGEEANFKISSWNIAGIRACIKKDAFKYVKKEDADIVCLQEVKCSKDKLPPEVNIPGYYKYWDLGMKAGYAGVGLYSKTKPISVKYGIGNQEYDSEGRLITAEYDKFYVVVTYVPNSGDGLKNLSKRLRWNAELRRLMKSLDEKKPVILAGDLNVCHQEIDIAVPKSNVRNAGFTIEEREGMTALLSDGFLDTFRELYPERSGAYTYWSYFRDARSKNIGWRLDYFVVSKRLMNSVCDNVIRSEVYGSDHCPVVLYLSV